MMESTRESSSDSNDEDTMEDTAFGVARFIGNPSTSTSTSTSTTTSKARKQPPQQQLDDSDKSTTPETTMSKVVKDVLRRNATAPIKTGSASRITKSRSTDNLVLGVTTSTSTTTSSRATLARSQSSRSLSPQNGPRRGPSSRYLTGNPMDVSSSSHTSATGMKGSGRYKREASFKRQGTGTAVSTGKPSVSSLLDDDLSDPDDEPIANPSLTLSTDVLRREVLTTTTSTGTTSSLHHSFTGNAGLGDHINEDSESRFLEDLMGQPTQLLHDFGVSTSSSTAHLPPALDRHVSVDLTGNSSRGGNPETPRISHRQTQPGFFARLRQFVTGSTVAKPLGSTVLAGFGKKYQVDQSVNLMDMDKATRQHTRRRQQHQKTRRPSLLNVMMDGDPKQLPSFQQHQRKRRSFVMGPPKRQSCWDNTKDCLCGWARGPVLLCLALAGVIALILTLLLHDDGSLMDKESHPSVPTPSPTLLPTVKEQTPVPTPKPTQGEKQEDSLPGTAQESSGSTVAPTVTPTPQNGTEAQAEDAKGNLSSAAKEQWDNLVGLITRNSLSPKEAFDDPSSSAYKALDWMIEYESVMDFISSDDPNQLLENYALMVFYFATHPDSKPRDAHSGIWTPPTLSITKNAAIFDPNKEWIHHAATPFCHWEGVQCGHLKRVVILNLTQHELQGTLPDELIALGHLIDLDLSLNQIGGTLPAIYGQMDHLRVINMRDNELKGKFPDEWAALASLETLDLSGNPGLQDVPDL